MTELTQELSLAQAQSLINSYAFDLGGDDAKQLIECWLNAYHASWIRLATIEALYLGRYKAISIEHILSVWLRIGTPNTHFTYEFERLICRKLPKHLHTIPPIEQHAPEVESDRSVEVIVSPPLKEKIKTTAPSQPVAAFCEGDTLNLEKAFQDPPSPSHNIPLISALGIPYQPDWSEFTQGNTSIHHFIPLPDVSSFFNKLKTFGEEKLEG